MVAVEEEVGQNKEGKTKEINTKRKEEVEQHKEGKKKEEIKKKRKYGRERQ